MEYSYSPDTDLSDVLGAVDTAYPVTDPTIPSVYSGDTSKWFDRIRHTSPDWKPIGNRIRDAIRGEAPTIPPDVSAEYDSPVLTSQHNRLADIERRAQESRKLAAFSGLAEGLMRRKSGKPYSGQLAGQLTNKAMQYEQQADNLASILTDITEKERRKKAYGSAASQIELPEEYKPIAPVMNVMASEDPEKFVDIMTRLASQPRRSSRVEYSPEAIDAAGSGDFSRMNIEYFQQTGGKPPAPKVEKEYEPWSEEQWKDYERKSRISSDAQARAAAAKIASQNSAEMDIAQSREYVPGLSVREGFQVDGVTAGKVQGAAGNYMGARNTLDKISDLYKKSGIVPVGELAREYESLITQLDLDVKGEGFAQLGVLAGPDMGILMKMVPDPTSWANMAKQWVPGLGDPIKPKIDAARRYLDNQFSSKIRARGFEVSDASSLIGRENKYEFSNRQEAEAANANGELLRGSTIYINGKYAGKVE